MRLLNSLIATTAIYWHKVMAITAVFAVGIHSTTGNNATGIGILCCMCLASASYLIRTYWFEAFYYVHIVSYICILPLIMLHFSAKFFTYACVFWVLDLVLRYVVTRQSITMRATILPGEVLRLTYEKKSRSYKSGQYVFLMIPVVNSFEFHPFSFSSSPDEEMVTIHVRVLGNWTRKLHDYVIAQSVGKENSTVDVHVIIEGPYGTNQLDISNSEYEVFSVMPMR